MFDWIKKMFGKKTPASGGPLPPPPSLMFGEVPPANVFAIAPESRKVQRTFSPPPPRRPEPARSSSTSQVQDDTQYITPAMVFSAVDSTASFESSCSSSYDSSSSSSDSGSSCSGGD